MFHDPDDKMSKDAYMKSVLKVYYAVMIGVSLVIVLALAKLCDLFISFYYFLKGT